MEGGRGREFSDRYRKSSPWPPFVALGLVVAEGGVLFGSAPVAIAGLLLLAASVVGVLEESSFAATHWRPAAGVAILYAAAGGLLVGLTTATLRGWAILAAAGLVGLAAVGRWLVETRRL